MADSTTYHRFALSFISPWNIGTETNHIWHNKFSVSGTLTMDDADAEATALDLAIPILALATTKTSLIEWSYYPSGSNTASQVGTYAEGTHPGTNDAYSAASGIHANQLEVCALARCPVGKNSRGKEVFLRKWCHDVSSASDPNTLSVLTSESATLNKWNNGAGPHDVVPVSPSTGLQGGPWVFEAHLYTHQLRRGSKKKKAASSDSSTLSTIEKLIGLAGAASQLTSEAG